MRSVSRRVSMCRSISAASAAASDSPAANPRLDVATSARAARLQFNHRMSHPLRRRFSFGPAYGGRVPVQINLPAHVAEPKGLRWRPQGRLRPLPNGLNRRASEDEGVVHALSSYREHAMKSFLSRFGSLIAFVLSGFDRLRFRGESRLLNNGRGVESYLYQCNLRCIDFPKHGEQLTQTLRRQTEQDAKEQGVPLKPLNSGAIDKEAAALELARDHGKTSGRIAVLSAVESARVFRLRKNSAGLVTPVKQEGKCAHYYHYFQHPDLGLCYVRVQTWFPFPIRVGLNGRAWLCRQLERRGGPFQRRTHSL